MNEMGHEFCNHAVVMFSKRSAVRFTQRPLGETPARAGPLACKVNHQQLVVAQSPDGWTDELTSLPASRRHLVHLRAPVKACATHAHRHLLLLLLTNTKLAPLGHSVTSEWSLTIFNSGFH